ncbi:uncharacterized protein LOC129232126 [Uloborus diversus]|uniref:uncharacterized protein LOC129232126 n=1 Tax=Uloborus diversus TaxID=327109 RepID=UPI002408FB8A|nr:uncharacterized protein LOC129232126 [Uloborus diversus]
MMVLPQDRINLPIQHISEDDSDFQSPPEVRRKPGPQRVEVEEVFVCEICKADISELDLGERSVHVNRCIDKASHPDVSTSATSTSTCTFILECPLCFRQFQAPEARSNHIKKCGKSRGLGVQSILKALQLQEKHALERISMGLPLKPQKPQKLPKKLSIKRLVEPKSRVQSDIQLAKALSLSLEEEERKKKGDFLLDVPLEGSISALELLPPSEFHRPGKKLTKKKGLTETPQLLLRTEEERQKLLLDRVTSIVAPVPDLIPPNLLAEVEGTVSTMATSQHQQAARVWLLSSKAEEKDSYYVEDLQEFVKPSEVEPGSKVADLSQVPGHRIYTQQPCEYSFSVHDQEGEEDDVCIEEPSGIADALSSLVLNPSLSDVDILAASGSVLPAHRLILIVRCPTLQEVLYIPDGEEKYILSLEDISSDVAIQFLRYVYTGFAKWKRKDLSQVFNLARRYHITELERLLNVESNKNQKQDGSEKDDVVNTTSRVTESNLQQNIIASAECLRNICNDDKLSTTSICNDDILSTTSDDDLEIVYNCINSSLRPTPQEDLKRELGCHLDVGSPCQIESDSDSGSQYYLHHVELEKVELAKQLPSSQDLKNTQHDCLDLSDIQETVVHDDDSNSESVEVMRLENQSVASDSSCREVEVLEVSQNGCKRQRRSSSSSINELCPKAHNELQYSFAPSEKQKELLKSDSSVHLDHSKLVFAQSIGEKVELEAENACPRNLNLSNFENYYSSEDLEHEARSSCTWDSREINLNVLRPYPLSSTTMSKRDSGTFQDCMEDNEKSFEECQKDNEENSFSSMDERWKDEPDIVCANDMDLDYQSKTSGMKKYRQRSSDAESMEDDVFVLHSSFDCDKQMETPFVSSDKCLKSISKSSADNSQSKAEANMDSYFGDSTTVDQIDQPQNELALQNGISTLEEDFFGPITFKASSTSDEDNSPKLRPETKKSCLSQVQNSISEKNFCSTPQKVSSLTSFSPNKITKKFLLSSPLPEVIIFSSDDELFSEPLPGETISQNELSLSNNVVVSNHTSFSENPLSKPLICEDDYNDHKDELTDELNESATSSDDGSAIGIACKLKENSSPESSPFIPLSKRLFGTKCNESFEDFQPCKKQEKTKNEVVSRAISCVKSCPSVSEVKAAGLKSSKKQEQTKNEIVSSAPSCVKSCPSVSEVKDSRTASGEPSFSLSDSPVTPLPNYSGMMTPHIKMALKKIGVKAMPKRKAIALLSQVYDATHPWVENGSIIHPVNSIADKDEKKVVNRKKRKSSCKKKDETAKRVRSESQSGKIDSVPKSEDDMSCDEYRADEIVEWNPSQQDDNEEEGPGKGDISLVRDQILNDEKLFESILHYKPLNLTEFQQELRDKGIKVSIQKLMDFLDEQCITFTCPRKEEYRKKQTTRSQNFRKRMIAKMSQKAPS